MLPIPIAKTARTHLAATALLQDNLHISSTPSKNGKLLCLLRETPSASQFRHFCIRPNGFCAITTAILSIPEHSRNKSTPSVSRLRHFRVHSNGSSTCCKSKGHNHDGCALVHISVLILTYASAASSAGAASTVGVSSPSAITLKGT